MRQLEIFQEEILTTISANYVPKWGVVEALREVIQEGLDAQERYGCKLKVKFKNGTAIVEDDGPGVPRAALALGVSDKRGDPDLKGQFGEGWKLAAMVLCRSSLRFSMETVGYAVSAGIVKHPAIGTDVLRFEMRPSARKVGTVFVVEGVSEADWEGAKAAFLAFSRKNYYFARGKSAGQKVMLPGGWVYVNGYLAARRDDMLFSYNLSGGEAKASQNRDRTIIDDAVLRKQAREALSLLTDLMLMEVYVRNCFCDNAAKFFEGNLAVVPCGEAEEKKWKKAIQKVMGLRVCLSDTPQADLEAVNCGYRVLHLPFHQRYLAERAGICYSSHVKLKRARLKPVELGEREKALLRWAKRLVAKWMGRDAVRRIRVVNSCDVPDMAGNTTYNGGLYDPCRDIIYLDIEKLHDPGELLKTLLHEAAHRKSGAPDASREFEDYLCSLAAQVIRKTSRVREPCA